MLELSESTAGDYLRSQGQVSSGELLVQSLSGGVANVVLKVFDVEGGQCFVLKQPLAKFKTETEWLVDIDRALVERDAMILVGGLLPKDSVPEVLWFDDENYVLAMTCAPVDSVIWKKALMDGHTSIDASTNAGMMLAMLHSATHNDVALKARYGDPKFFIQQRIDPYFTHTAEKHPEHAALLKELARKLLATQYCLIHGDFSPKNIFLVPESADSSIRPVADSCKLLLLDFEVAFYGHAAFDVSTLVNHFLLKGFVHRKGWRPFMVMADNFWQTYRQTAAVDLVRSVGGIAGHLLGGLLLARVDGKSPVEYLLPHADLQAQARGAANAILSQSDSSLEQAFDIASGHFDSGG